jgi:aryl-alcohol dehydrogenase-like predicted oxidoreductase/ribosomal protein S18 acetylase RimI-like enzyme
MSYVRLGRSSLTISRVALGAGPVPAAFTHADDVAASHVGRELLRHAIDRGINWFDTAAGYGEGRSESNLGDALRHLGALDSVHLATKVRLGPADLGQLDRVIRQSLADSCRRLGTRRVALLQLHNSITRERGDEPTSLSLDDVLGPEGVADTLERLRDDGLVTLIGFTGIGQAEALHAVAASGRFDTVQAPFNLANPSAGWLVGSNFQETDYGAFFAACQNQGMGVFAIRVFAGGALSNRAPSAHTFQTKFFPLDLYRRDEARAAHWQSALQSRNVRLEDAAVRFSLGHPAVTAAIIGFQTCEQIDAALAAAKCGPLALPINVEDDIQGGLAVRPSRPDELPAYLACSRDAQQRLRAKGLAQYLPAAHPEFADEMRQRVTHGTLMTAWSGGQPVGFFNWASEAPAMWTAVQGLTSAWYIAGMVVAPAARGREVGPRILRWCLADARRRRAAAVRLDCHASNAWLRGFYESHGFRACGIVETYPGYEVCLFEQPVAIPVA